MKDASEKLIRDRINELRKNTDFTSAIFDHLIGYAIIAADFDGNIRLTIRARISYTAIPPRSHRQ